ncbi:MAG: chemotaxis protein CheW, partial [Myxococcota bacterium]|nr:chemotaxis protein CheW [Myxococcota bacterium]
MCVELERLKQRVDELLSLVQHRRKRRIWDSKVDLLLCACGEQRFALPLRQVESVLPVCALSSIPEAPAWVLGSFDLHGDVLMVIDVAARLFGTPSVLNVEQLLLICRVEREVGGTGQAPNRQEVEGTGQAANRQEVEGTGQAANRQEVEGTGQAANRQEV